MSRPRADEWDLGSSAAEEPSEGAGTTKSPSPRHGPRSIAYRPDVDGLRALAVLSVIAFHAFPSLAPGGFVGVDVFFVISGFLICGIVLEDLRRGRFRILTFYDKRARRILPALLVVLTASLMLGWWTLLSDEFQGIGRHVLAGGAFVSNILLWREAGYFDLVAEIKPLLHLWSLGIEEQFYLVFPVLAWVAWRRKFSILGAMLLMIAGSLALNIMRLERHRVGTFYLPITRLWEILVGGVVGMVSRRGWWLNRLRPVTKARWESAIAWSGLTLIVVSIAAFSRESPYPGWRAICPVAGASALILGGRWSFPARRLLGNRAMIAIGLVSYPLYLWHWPLLTLSRILKNESTVAQRTVVVVIAAVLAVLTYQFVEKPVRFNRSTRTPLVLVGALLAVIAVGAFAGFGFITSRYYPDDVPIVDARADWAYPPPNARILGREARFLGDSPAKVLFIGDSNAEQYFPRIQLLVSQGRARSGAVFVTEGGGLPIVGSGLGSGLESRHDHGLGSLFLSLVEETTAKKVVLAAQWIHYFGPQSPYFVQDGTSRRELRSAEGRHFALQSLTHTLQRITSRGVKVYLVLNIPVGAEMAPANLLSRDFLGNIRFHYKDLDRIAFEQANAELFSDLRQVARDASAEVIDPLPFLCSAKTCPVIQGAFTPLYKDATHLRASFVRTNVTYLDRIMVD